jgi:acid stress-induced BolA-like protein IbaG/YrbA
MMPLSTEHPLAQSIASHLQTHLKLDYVKVEGDGQHFYGTFVSDAFEGLPRIKRHQLIYQILGDRMKEEIHALSIKAFTPQEWKNIK